MSYFQVFAPMPFDRDKAVSYMSNTRETPQPAPLNLLPPGMTPPSLIENQSAVGMPPSPRMPMPSDPRLPMQKE